VAQNKRVSRQNILRQVQHPIHETNLATAGAMYT